MKKLPEYFITFDPEVEESGINMIALTTRPAIGLTALRFSMQDVEQHFSYTDYPESVKENARRGIELNEAQDNKCATQVGKVRAQQLAQGEPVSVDTVRRMYSYLSRAAEFYNPEDQEACGTISYLLWGGPEALTWSKNVLDSLDSDEEMVEMSEYKFSIDEEKRIIAGPVLIPNKRIYRRDEDGEYYVIFKEDVIEKMVEKFSSENREIIFNMEHSEEDSVKGFIKGAWIVEDPELDKAVYYGFTDLPKGTYFIEAKISSDEDWDRVKQMPNVGFSVEGLMGFFKSQTFNNTNQPDLLKQQTMEKKQFTACKLQTKRMFSKENKRFEEVLVTDEEEVLIVDSMEAGATVEVLDENGSPVTAENGTYIVESEGLEITVEEGAIASVEELPMEEPVIDEPVIDEPVIDEPVQDGNNSELIARIDEMAQSMQDLISKLAELETRIENAESMTMSKEKEDKSMNFNSNKLDKSERLDFIKSLNK